MSQKVNDVNLSENNYESNQDILSSISGDIIPPIQNDHQSNLNLISSISGYVVPITMTLSNVFHHHIYWYNSRGGTCI